MTACADASAEGLDQSRKINNLIFTAVKYLFYQVKVNKVNFYSFSYHPGWTV